MRERKSGRVACAYYEPSKKLLYVLEDTQETADQLEALLMRWGPDGIGKLGGQFLSP